jgi:hypothetical protein
MEFLTGTGETNGTDRLGPTATDLRHHGADRIFHLTDSSTWLFGAAAISAHCLHIRNGNRTLTTDKAQNRVVRVG